MIWIISLLCLSAKNWWKKNWTREKRKNAKTRKWKTTEKINVWLVKKVFRGEDLIYNFINIKPYFVFIEQKHWVDNEHYIIRMLLKFNYVLIVWIQWLNMESVGSLTGKSLSLARCHIAMCLSTHKTEISNHWNVSVHCTWHLQFSS